jgi:hypothetical protein
MNLESDDTDNDDNILFDNDNSTDDSEHDKKAQNSINEQKKKISDTRENCSN